MDDQIARALEQDRLVDITTTGRRSGEPRRIEIGFHVVDGAIYVTGRPGRRSWYANLLANPQLTFHIKQSAQLDRPASATPILDEAERRRLLGVILDRIPDAGDLQSWLQRSPLVRVDLLEQP